MEWMENCIHLDIGKNLFLIDFYEAKDKDIALKYAPWFFGRKYMYTFLWFLNFDVTIGHYNMLPIWIKIRFRLLILEQVCHKLARSLGKVLFYICGKKDFIP